MVIAATKNDPAPPVAQAPIAKHAVWPGVQLAQQACEYWTDACQRSVLFRNVMRQRGNNYYNRAAEQVPNVLHFQFEPVMSGRDLPRPVNYGLVRILPSAGVKVDPRKQPFIASFNRTATRLGDDCRWTSRAQEEVQFPLEKFGSPLFATFLVALSTTRIRRLSATEKALTIRVHFNLFSSILTAIPAYFVCAR